ncbi:MAG: glycosyltransferase family 4 protein [Verrucomicrobiota bacterium]
MRIALLFDHFGPYHLARLRAAGQVADMVAVEFYTRSGDYAWEVADRKELKVTTVSAGLREAVTSGQFEALLANHLDQVAPDVVVIPGWASRESLAALNWCLDRRVPAVLMSESCSHDEVRVGWKEWVKRRIVGCCPAALVGGSLHQGYLEELGLKREQISLGYDAVDNGYFAEGARPGREKAGRDRHGLFLVSARFIEKKNLPRLIEAYARYRQAVRTDGGSRDPWSLVLLGDGELRPALEQQVRELGLVPFVSMPGFLQYEELPGYYARASAFIHASTTEQWGLVVNEAMASGLPVLVSNRCGCAEDLVEEGINGFTFDPEDVQGMAAVMGRMTALPEEKLRQMGCESEQIIADWGPARFAEGMRQAAARALSTGGRKPSLVDRVLLKILMSR